MKKSLTYISLLIAMLSANSLHVFAEREGADKIIDKLKIELQNAKSARDSVRILYNIYDLSDLEGRVNTSWLLYETAVHADDDAAQQDMLRILSGFYSHNDTVISDLHRRASLISNPEARKATQTYISNQHFLKMSNTPGNEIYETALLDSISNSHDLMSSDKYDKLSLLYQLIIYLGTNSEGALFNEIFEKYERMIDELPMSDYPLKNQYMLTASEINSRYKEYRKSIYYEVKLLEICDKLQQKHIKNKHIYRNYDVAKFRCFERILRSFKNLSPQQLEAVHDSMQYYYNKNNDVVRHAEKTKQMDALYLFASKRYKEAIPALKQALEWNMLSDYQRVNIYDYIAEAAKAIGDTKTQIWGMENARRELSKLDSIRRETAIREIEIRDYFKDKPIFFEAETVKQQDKQKVEKLHDNILMVITSAIAILLLIYMVLYFRLRNKIANHR